MLRALLAIVAMPQAKLDSRRKRGLDRDDPQIEKVLRPGTAGGRMRQHRIGCIEAGEQDEVGQQENPEAVAGDDALGRRPLVAAVGLGARAELVRIVSDGPRISDRRDAGLAALHQRDARFAPLAIDRGEFLGGQLIFRYVAPGEDDECREGADQADDDHPPDMPDQREAGDDGEEGRDEAGRAVARHFDRLVIGQGR